ncbi:uncharacterized protein C10orf120 homolog [Gracilinanus agilis]|uniref:uncharacterized protein C10orf120 homolog n=1 Tax=Gracilinanus agilis TaxID=191870 RepID=UPI001CFCBD20|nr:uncharacterized protein C10orf120 homolog [Gracilinanus agilis]
MKKHLKSVANEVSCSIKDPLLSTDDLNLESLLSIWMKYYGGDPRIALGKYSPLEKEILRLGGVHTVATRRLLAQKQKEEEKMLKELRQKSPDYKRAMEYNNVYALLNTGKKNMEKAWTARIIVPREELQVPSREKTNINKHIERMKMARGPKDWEYTEQCHHGSFLPAVAPDSKAASQERDDDEASSKANKIKIKMNVTFKEDERIKPLIIKPNEMKTFDLKKKQERKIAGHTNRIRFLPFEFPGDMLLLSQNYKSTRIHLNDNMKSLLSNKEGHWKNCLQIASEDSPLS